MILRSQFIRHERSVEHEASSDVKSYMNISYSRRTLYQPPRPSVKKRRCCNIGTNNVLRRNVMQLPSAMRIGDRYDTCFRSNQGIIANKQNLKSKTDGCDWSIPQPRVE